MRTKTMKKSLLLLAITTIMLFAMSITASADEDMGIKQTSAGSGSVDISWNAELGTDHHYHIQYSTDGSNWIDGGYSTSAEDYIYMSQGSSYYVRVLVVSGSSHHSGCTGTVTKTSNPVIVKTTCATPTGLTQTGATQDSISMSWDAVSGADYYNIYVYTYSSGYVLLGTSTTASYTATGLSASYAGYICVSAVGVGAGNYVVESYKTSSVTMKTVPAKVTQIAMTNYWSSLSECCYGWTSDSNADGYQIQVKKSTGKKTYLNKTTTSTYAYCDPYPKGVFTKARVRAYITIGTQKVYGPWSDYTYNGVTKKATYTRSKNGKKITLKWKKVSGISSYKIYISTKSDSGYKKVATLNSKKTSYVIKKYGKKNLKKGTTYYVKIAYVTKVGKKKITSGIVSKATVY